MKTLLLCAMLALQLGVLGCDVDRSSNTRSTESALETNAQNDLLTKTVAVDAKSFGTITSCEVAVDTSTQTNSAALSGTGCTVDHCKSICCGQKSKCFAALNCDWIGVGGCDCYCANPAPGKTCESTTFNPKTYPKSTDATCK